MNIAIIGYGKMGKEIEKAAKDRGHKIVLIIDAENRDDLHSANLSKADVAIEFSSPSSAFENITKCLEASTPVVSGTTGWLDKWDEAGRLAEQTGSGLFYASNFSIGVNILFALNKYLAGIMENFPEYEVSMKEIHHIHKADSPSGTAITLASQITERLHAKSGWSLENDDKDKIYIDARREGEVNGFHQVIYDTDIETITISHNAKSRKGFATGAVLAAEYMQNRSGIHTMQDLLKF